jgi:hypothetical protein
VHEPLSDAANRLMAVLLIGPALDELSE